MHKLILILVLVAVIAGGVYFIKQATVSVSERKSEAALPGDRLLRIAAPSDLISWAQPPGRINLRWTDNSDNEKNFEIWRKTSTSTFNWIGIYNSVSSTLITGVTLKYQDGNLPKGTYWYEVRACAPYLGCSRYSNITSTTVVQ